MQDGIEILGCATFLGLLSFAEFFRFLRCRRLQKNLQFIFSDKEREGNWGSFDFLCSLGPARKVKECIESGASGHLKDTLGETESSDNQAGLGAGCHRALPRREPSRAGRLRDKCRGLQSQLELVAHNAILF